jgi:hypothetical protein
MALRPHGTIGACKWRAPDEHLRVHIDDGQGHWIRVAVVGPSRKIRFEVAGPADKVPTPWEESLAELAMNIIRARGAGAGS